MTETSQYKVLSDAPICGTWRNKGDVITLRDDQATAYLPPFGKQIERVSKQASKSSEPATEAKKQ